MDTQRNTHNFANQETCSLPVYPLLTVKDACRLLNIRSATLRRWNNNGLITAYRIGTRSDRRFRQQDIGELLYSTTECLQAHSIIFDQ